MNEKFTEYSETGKNIQMTVEAVLIGIGEMYDIHYGMPAHDVARRFLNEIYEFESAWIQDQKARSRAAREVKENNG